MHKPELLLPAGNMESFFAAINGGADAIYVGVQKFNARSRAKNFSFDDISNMAREAHKNKCKLYITLNTLIKNEEIHTLIETLDILSQCNVDALIIQDFAVANIVRKFYRNFEIHSSTQMGIHNSEGCNFLANNNIRRAILSRELNLGELSKLTAKSPIPVEIFVHGALCYSFSGQCLFSSYLGGFSANRGMCAQVCRRKFVINDTKANLFSLKDLQLIDYVPDFAKLNIKSLKIEGRMKSPEYVFNTAKAYRMVIDNHTKIDEAKELLNFDFAREKTSWFVGKNLKNAITDNPGTGVFIGKIFDVTEKSFSIISDVKLTETSKIRVRSADDSDKSFVRINKIDLFGSKYLISADINTLKTGDELYLLGTKKLKVNTNFSDYTKKQFRQIGYKQKEAIKNSFKIARPLKGKTHLYLRISDFSMLNKYRFNDFEAIILKLKFSDIELLLNYAIKPEIKAKIIIELPKYISELKLAAYKELIRNLFAQKFKDYSISHISQIGLLPERANVFTNEHVYLLNDIAIQYVQSMGVKNYCLPLENDYPNMLKGRDRKGIIPVYFHPELFYSRMPVKAGDNIKDEAGNRYDKNIIDGFTQITDANPVSLSHNVNKFQAKGFNSFLIDFSLGTDAQKLDSIVNSVLKSQKIQNSSTFNIKKGLR